MTLQERLEQKGLRQKSRSLLTSLLKKYGFEPIKSDRGCWIKESTPFLYQTICLSNRELLKIDAGYRVAFPWSIFDKTLSRKELERVEAIWKLVSDEPIYGGSMFGYDGSISLSYHIQNLQSVEGYLNFKLRCTTFFEETLIPFFKRYETIDEFFQAYESQDLSLSAFYIDPMNNMSLEIAQICAGCYYYLVNERLEALKQFHLARKIYLDRVSSIGPYAPLLEILSILIKHLDDPKNRASICG